MKKLLENAASPIIRASKKVLMIFMADDTFFKKRSK